MGADYTFDTIVKTNGINKEGTIFGDIIIDAKGDPTLGSTYFDKQERFLEGLCDSLKAKGIKNIAGDLVIHEDYATELYGNNMKMYLGDLGTDYSVGSTQQKHQDIAGVSL